MVSGTGMQPGMPAGVGSPSRNITVVKSGWQKKLDAQNAEKGGFPDEFDEENNNGYGQDGSFRMRRWLIEILLSFN
tara:strand:- start:4776 stop:5003 length:228 start_codon:yes stop_codon:yes gene_type:complete